LLLIPSVAFAQRADISKDYYYDQATTEWLPWRGTVSQASTLTVSSTTTEYTEGDTDASITAPATLFESLTNSNRLTTLQGHELSNSNVISVEIMDGDGTQITSFGGGTQYTENDVDASITGTAFMFEGFSDDLKSISEAVPLPIFNASNVTVDTAGTSGLEVVQDTAADLNMTEVNSGDILTSVQLIDNIVQAEDAVAGSGDAGVMSLAVRNDTLAPAAADGDYTSLQTNAMGSLWVHEEENSVDSGNSTTSVLGSGATFTGTGVDVLAYEAVTITLASSHDSATDGMTFQFSTDNSNWDDVYTFTMDISSSDTRRFQFPTTAQYFRVVYTNGGTLQTHFRVQTILHHNNQLTSIHRLADSSSPDRSAQVVKSAIIAQQGGGGPSAGNFIPIQATNGGNLRISLQEASDGMDIGAGNAGSETLRVSISTDDVNMSAIKTAIELIDTVGGGTEATAQRVTIASDSTGLLSIDDNGGSITIDGTVTEANSTAILADTAIMSEWDNTDSDGASVSGNKAHDAAWGNTEPVGIGLEARTTLGTAVGDGDMVKAMGDDNGRQVTVNNCPRDLVTQNVKAISDTTEATILDAAASTFHDLTSLVISNTSSNSTIVDIRDASGGTVVLSVGLSPKGGYVLPYNTPFTQTTVNNIWTASLRTAVTDVIFTVQACKNN